MKFLACSMEYVVGDDLASCHRDDKMIFFDSFE